ncbi:MAG: radical SAM protein [Treponema sp.]|jgi:MoaA/NifB/PqqE/SkfB family radical SAM enzyme|nr:radical SAM protein [Treponema sp.]
MEDFFNLEGYLNEGLRSLVKDALRQTLRSPQGTAFFGQYGARAKKAERLRRRALKAGDHIPPFLIASVTRQCNLGCAGCYDRARQDPGGISEMSPRDWSRIFGEAEELGVAAILLAGGEPLTRPDVLEEAAQYSSMLFPIFTNGTMLDKKYAEFFEKYRHLIPIISVEGDEVLTDKRRGCGVYAQAMRAMEYLKAFDLLFGGSVTVTSRNIQEITQEETVADLKEKGCKVLVFVEYVPVTNPELALDLGGRRALEERVRTLRNQQDLIIISFPGDEAASGGCLGAGRGFFHINAVGGAEPCPFSPYSDASLKTASLRDVLRSPLFMRLQQDGVLGKTHTGGCVLFEEALHVQSLVSSR